MHIVFLFALVSALFNSPRRKDPLDFTAECSKKRIQPNKEKLNLLKLSLIIMCFYDILSIQKAISIAEAPNIFYLIYIPFFIIGYLIIFRILHKIIQYNCNTTMLILLFYATFIFYRNLKYILLYFIETNFQIKNLIEIYKNSEF